MLKVKDGKVEYLMRSGNDIVRAVTTEQVAAWAMKELPATNECIDGFPEYCIHCGDFYFRGEPAGAELGKVELNETELKKTELNSLSSNKRAQKRKKTIFEE